jgi:AAA15 family ATPase/GTPase
MLITFKVENFMSFDKETVFSMVAGNAENHPTHIIKGKKQDSLAVDVLKAAVIYGANASGKSNLLKAVDFAKQIIVSGIKNVIIDNKHFRLGKENLQKPTKFEFELKLANKVYAYGFVVQLNERKITEEWLFELNKTTEKAIFERNLNAEGKITTKLGLKLDKKTKNRFDVYSEDLQHDQLFLTEINSKNLEGADEKVMALNYIFIFLTSYFLVIFPNTIKDMQLLNKDNETSIPAFLELLNKYISYFNTGIKKINAVAVKEKDFIDSISREYRNNLLEFMNYNRFSIATNKSRQNFFVHRNDKNELDVALQLNIHKGNNVEVAFDNSEESDGTKRIIDFIPLLSCLQALPLVVFIDEIECSLHPELTYKIIELFLSISQNVENQLIVTTHESNLLNLDLLRRDEIWFTEKDENGATQCYSLEEFAPRKDLDIRKAYLQGRFGAIPFIGNISELGWETKQKN